MEKLFGTDGIRGVANTYPINVETATAVGKAVARHFTENDTAGGRHIVIGQDTRISGDMLAYAIAAGACSAGLDVQLLGVLPTPGIARMTVATGAVAGVVVSASHNPFEDNGIKLFNANGYKLSDAVENRIETLIADSREIEVASFNRIGRITQIPEATDRYADFLSNSVDCGQWKKIKIVIDCANGATYKVAPMLFRRFNIDVITLFCEPDGININAQCGSQHPERLAERVMAQGADLGVAFDGDGDRMIAVDETGHVLTGDQIMAICANDLKQRGLLKNNLVVSTVMSNLGFGQALKQMGIRWLTTQVGDRYVIEKMCEKDAVLGGEDSGHMIFHHLNTTGDGLIAALQLIDAMQRAGKSLSDLSRIMTVFPQALINVDVSHKPDLQTIPEINSVIEQVEQRLNDQGRVLVRYSGTQNMCRVMVEGPTREITDKYCNEIAETVRQTIGS